jgi:serine/threonine protein kinase
MMACIPQPPSIPDYELTLLIGEGAYGQIWMGRDALGLYRAVKVIRYTESKSLESYQSEFHGIRHYAPYSRKYDRLIEIHHVGIREQDGFYYYVMDLADDISLGNQVTPDYQPKTLRNYIEQHEDCRLPVAEALEIGMEIAESLSELHSENLVHRDVKPDNILFINGQWKLGDIGFVSTRGGKTFVGSLGYLAPEGPGHPPADVHGLGKILYEMVTGNEVGDFPECPSWVFDATEEASEFKALNKIILKAADPIARNRHQSGGELMEDLMSIMPAGDELENAGQRADWGRYIYAGLAVVILAMVCIYVRKIDAALDETLRPPPVTAEKKMSSMKDSGLPSRD